MQVHQTPTLLLTRPRASAERFATGLTTGLTGAQVVIAPLMEIVGTGVEIALDGIDALILTSEAAVSFLPPVSLPAYCVGARTAEVARAHGLHPEVLGPDAEGLVQALLSRQPKGRLLHLHGTHTRGDIAGRLRAAGLWAKGLAVYDQRDLPPGPDFHDALTRPGLIVPLFSPRSAALFATASGPLRPDTTVLALSPAVAQALPPSWRAQIQIAQAPTTADMEAALNQLGVQRNSP